MTVTSGTESLDTSEMSPAMLYHAAALRGVPRLLGMLDRDPESPTVGSFDREHWAWKFRDFPINMLQTGMVPMAMLYAARPGDSPYAGEPR
ncbi:MAG: hypothetical protein ACT4R6_08675, partial [Gemmatimonadaceae bacterium]